MRILDRGVSFMGSGPRLEKAVSRPKRYRTPGPHARSAQVRSARLLPPQAHGDRMSSFFRKVASAFVVIEDDANAQAAQSEAPAPGGLEDITAETSSLLAQLEGRP